MGRLMRVLATLLMLTIIGIAAGLSQTMFELPVDESSWPLRALLLVGFLIIGIILSAGYFAIIFSTVAVADLRLKFRVCIVAMLAIPVILALSALIANRLPLLLSSFLIAGTAILAMLYLSQAQWRMAR
jgi:hypothetical protein